MILCDTGPLIALIDQSDQHHSRCVEALKELPPEPLVLSWPCFTEAMYFLWRVGGIRAQEELWSFLVDGLVVLHQPGAEEWQRVRELMQQYSDIPMDLADASVVVMSERLGVRRVFTLDRHFHAYRIEGKHTFEIVP